MLLGLDVGTTEVKAMLVDPTSGSQHVFHEHLDLILPGQDRVEQDPEALWSAVVAAVRRVLSLSRTPEVDAVSLAVQGGTLIPLGPHGKPAGNAIVWMDQRARPQATALNRSYGRKYFYERTGWTPTGCLPLLNILWLREQDPGLLSRTDRFAFVGDFITERLCGEWVTDQTNAAITMLYDLGRGDWDEELMELAGVERGQLPTLAKPAEALGALKESARRELGIRGRKTVVGNGAHDQYSASLGAGAMRDGCLLVSGGTAWVLLLTCDRPVYDATAYPAPGRHLVEGKWGLLTSMPTSGASVNWFRERLCRSSEADFLRTLEGEAATIPPGAEGVTFLPYFTGSTMPTWDAGMRGSILGLGLKHRRAHLLRALLEGVALDVFWRTEAMRSLGLEARSVRMIGGSTRSALWPQIVADVLDMSIEMPKTSEAAALGAGVLAGVAREMFPNITEGAEQLVSVRTEVPPDTARSSTYRSLFRGYKLAFDGVQRALPH